MEKFKKFLKHKVFLLFPIFILVISLFFFQWVFDRLDKTNSAIFITNISKTLDIASKGNYDESFLIDLAHIEDSMPNYIVRLYRVEHEKLILISDNKVHTTDLIKNVNDVLLFTNYQQYKISPNIHKVDGIEYRITGRIVRLKSNNEHYLFTICVPTEETLMYIKPIKNGVILLIFITYLLNVSLIGHFLKLDDQIKKGKKRDSNEQI
jgi:hypothetical protein